MANREHLEILKQGIDVWNRWRSSNTIIPDLIGAELNFANLNGINLKNTNLAGARIQNSNITGYIWENREKLLLPDLSYSDLRYSIITESNLSFANLRYANLEGSQIENTSLRGALLDNANFMRTKISSVDFTHAVLVNTDLSYATINAATFAYNDISEVEGLDTIIHTGPSHIGIHTIYGSSLKIPDSFLAACEIPSNFIEYLPSLLGTSETNQFHSCFISYSHKDEEFARHLYSQMRKADIVVWFAPEEMRAGQKIHDQISQAIKIHDRLLLVLSENSIQSEWVISEIRRARKIEKEEKQRKLFPIRLVEFNAIQNWECFDVDTGKDLAIELREYFIPDFSNWKDSNSFRIAFERLLRDLNAEDEKIKEI